jgi:hypothetical protein
VPIDGADCHANAARDVADGGCRIALAGKLLRGNRQDVRARVCSCTGTLVCVVTPDASKSNVRSGKPTSLDPPVKAGCCRGRRRAALRIARGDTRDVGLRIGRHVGPHRGQYRGPTHGGQHMGQDIGKHMGSTWAAHGQHMGSTWAQSIGRARAGSRARQPAVQRAASLRHALSPRTMLAE